MLEKEQIKILQMTYNMSRNLIWPDKEVKDGWKGPATILHWPGDANSTLDELQISIQERKIFTVNSKILNPTARQQHRGQPTDDQEVVQEEQ